MKRDLPVPATIQARPTVERQGHPIELRVDDLTLISPVHGGGVNWDNQDHNRHVRPIDPVTPLRLSAVRGQLRFWWRATHGCLLTSVERMLAVESAIWGKASLPSQVQIRLEAVHYQAKPQTIFQVTTKDGRRSCETSATMRELAYGAFGLQPKTDTEEEAPPGILSQVQGSGRMIVLVPQVIAPLGGIEPLHNIRQQVEDALTAWLLFGGIGGRTRRGFGAVTGKPSWKLPRASEFIARFPSSAVLLPLVPSLHGARLAVSPKTQPTPLDALKDALDRMKRFRQGEHIGRNERDRSPGNKKPAGRSRWPEPETIRMLTRRSSPQHQKRFVMVDKFPRARFGLPIIFHFQDRKLGEPDDTTLKPASPSKGLQRERMASPIVLRPLFEGGSYRAIALQLRVPEADAQPLVLEGKNLPSAVPVDASLTPAEAARIKPINAESKTDPLSAFLSFFAR